MLTKGRAAVIGRWRPPNDFFLCDILFCTCLGTLHTVSCSRYVCSHPRMRLVENPVAVSQAKIPFVLVRNPTSNHGKTSIPCLDCFLFNHSSIRALFSSSTERQAFSSIVLQALFPRRGTKIFAASSIDSFPTIEIRINGRTLNFNPQVQSLARPSIYSTGKCS